MITLRFRYIVSGLLVLIGILLYCHTLPSGYVFDDRIYLEFNPLFKDAHSFAFPFNFRAFATLSSQLGLDRDLSTNFILRPVTYFTFYLNYLVDGMNPRGYRAVNIAIHFTNAVLLFHILLHLFGATKLAEGQVASSTKFIALSSSLLFLVHPLQTESVTYIVQRFTSLGVLFYLLTILTYFLSFAAENRRTALIYRLVSVASLIAGMLSKEETFTAPFLIVLLDWLVMGTSLKTACKRAIPYFLCLPIIPALIIATAMAQEFGNTIVTGALTIAIAADSRDYQYHYALTQLSVMLTYLRLLLFPAGLNIDREYPASTSILQIQVLISLTVITSILSCAWLNFHRNRQDVRSALLFCSVLWFFLTLCPSSSIAPLPDLIAEHRSYLPSIGALLALVCCADLLRTEFFNRREEKIAMNLFMAFWISSLGVATLARNYVWRSPISLLKDTTTKSPNKRRNWSNLATTYYECNKPREAIDCLVKAIAIEPDYFAGYVDLAGVQNEIGRYREALEVSKSGLKRSPKNYLMLYNMGMSYYCTEQIQSAIDALNESIAAFGTDKAAHVLLALAHTRLQHYDKALAEYRIAEPLAPFDPHIHSKIVELENLENPRNRSQQ